MPSVDLVVTDTRVWARGPATHWDVPPSVVLGSNGDLVVGEPLTPPTQVCSAIQYVGADRIALLPRVPAIGEAMTAVFGTVLRNLGVPIPCEQVTIVCPTEWGGRRRAIIDDAVRRYATDIVFEDTAIRAVVADAGAARSRRTVVLEFGPLSTTATAVVRSHQGIHIETCEHEPNLAISDIAPETTGFDELSPLFDRLLAGQPADMVQAIGVSDPAKLDLIRSVAQQFCGPSVELRAIAGADLVRGPRPEPEYQPEITPMPTTEWMQPLRQRAAAMQPPGRNTKMYVLGAVAAVAVVAATAIGAVFAFGGSEDKPTASATSASVPAGPTSLSTGMRPAPTTTPKSASETVGRVRFQMPAGWRFAQAPDPSKSRVDLVPSDGTRARISVIQTPVAAGTGYEQVAANLDAQMKQRPSGSVSELKRDVVFGGKSGLAYTEQPGDGSTVNWHVLVEHGLQVSTGCQYISDWQSLAQTCEQFAASIQTTP
ncbi:type VII secretion-associated protein [Nocardia sp. CA-119907]|uniref:type VII secretion-associated protein n=1 Tax=Nocardia sp. CA-119907 TaxID=3239973 RepID=UPI003D98B888